MYCVLNAALTHNLPIEAIQFRNNLPCPLHHILGVDPTLGPVFMSKMNLADADMSVWVHPEDVLCIEFVVPTPLINFNLYFTMGYAVSAPYFCCTRKTVAELFDAIWNRCH